MKRIPIWIAMVSIFNLLLVHECSAQPGMQWHGSAGWGMGSHYGRIYDPKTVETIRGIVVKVEKMTPMKGMSQGVHLVVKTDQEEISVHLGPAWYIENQDIQIEPNDAVEITGSKVTLEGKPALIAAEVKKNQEILKLRDENGFPVWSGWRRR